MAGMSRMKILHAGAGFSFPKGIIMAGALLRLIERQFGGS